MAGELTLREIASLYARKAQEMVDYITEGSPILGSTLFEPTTHGLSHAYEELAEVTGGNFVDMDSPLSKAESISQLRWKNLSILGATHEKGVDAVNQLGGWAAYLNRKLPSILSTTAQNAEASLIYDLFLPYAKANSKLQDAGGTGDTNYSIYTVRWEAGNFAGLFDPNGFGQGAIMDVIPLSGGNPYKDSSGISVYGADLKSYIGFNFANPRNIAGIVNINATNLPLETEIDKMLLDARVGAPGTTYIYCHPQVLTWLYTYKNEKLRTVNSDREVNNIIEAWNGVQFITSYNFKAGTEADVTV